MAPTSDAVVVGGGIIGASVAYHLARAGLKVALVERRHIGYGGSGASTAIIRMHYDNAPETRLAVASYPAWADWHSYAGHGDPCFVKSGVLWLAGEVDAARLRNNVTMQRAIGAKCHAVTPLEVRHIEPALHTDDLAVAAWEPESGYVDPLAATFAFAEAAREQGAELWLDTTAVEVTVGGGRVVGLRTERGYLNTPVVVNAAGPWAMRVAQMVDVGLPIAVERRQVGVFGRPPELRRDHVAVVDEVLGTYLRPGGDNTTLLGIDARGDPANADDFNRSADPDFPERARRRLAARMPAMAQAIFRGGWSGLFDLTPDGKAILGEAGPEGFYLACGFSGTGFKLAPAVGLCLSELITDGRARTVDITPFRLARFAEGQPIRGEWEYAGGPGVMETKSQALGP